MIGLSPSTYYYPPKHPRASREREDAELRQAIEAVQADFPKAGYRTVPRYLRRAGRFVGERRIRRIMKRFSLHAEIKRAFVHTTDSNHSHRVYPNRLPGRVLTCLNQAWAADLTNIRIANSFVYLAVILDLFSRRVIGWAISKHIDAELALAALKQAIQQRQPPPGCVHHSDRGVQYASSDDQGLLTAAGIACSMSRKGNCWDNACVESFFGSLKKQVIHDRRYATREEAKQDIFEWIEVFYNRQRRHSTLGYRSPAEFEAMRKVA